MLPVEIEFKDGEPSRVVMTQGKFEIKAEIDDWQDQADIARGLGLSREDLDETLPIQACSTGNTMLMVPVRSLADLGRCRPNIPLLEEVYARNDFASRARPVVTHSRAKRSKWAKLGHTRVSSSARTSAKIRRLAAPPGRWAVTWCITMQLAWNRLMAFTSL